MKLNVDAVPPELMEPAIRVGDVFQNQRGKFQVVIRIHGDSVFLLAFNELGEIVGTDRYAHHYMERKRIVGRVREMPTLEVEWT